MITLFFNIAGLPELYTTTTTCPILNLIPEGCRAQCHLHTCMECFLVASILMEIAPSDSGLLSLLILHSMADPSTTE